MAANNAQLFEQAPVPRAVIALAVPTVLSQLITVLYNMADTFFIGQMNDPYQVAAATLAMPPFILLTGIANLLGIGGASLVARSLGEGDMEKAGQSAAFSIWSAIGLALAYGLAMMLLRPVVLPAIGAGADTYDLCYRYTFWTITVGAVPTVLNALLAHLVRAEGYSRQASLGVAFGGVLNIFLDPVFIFVLDLQITGAALATMLSNLAATVYFLVLLRRGKTVITLDPRRFTLGRGIPREVLLVGFPSAVMNLMSIFSNIMLNRLVGGYSSQAIAGMGIAKKIDMLAYAIATGMSQGVLPLIAYNYAAHNAKRMRSVIKTAFLYSMAIAVFSTVYLFVCAVPVSRLFISDAVTVEYSQRFLRAIAITCPCVSVTMMVITLFQATGQKGRPMFLSLLRKGGLDVPFMLLLNGLVGVYGIAWATPIADVLSMSVSLCLFFPFWRRIEKG